jgi:hypothetical protein
VTPSLNQSSCHFLARRPPKGMSDEDSAAWDLSLGVEEDGDDSTGSVAVLGVWC